VSSTPNDPNQPGGYGNDPSQPGGYGGAPSYGNGPTDGNRSNPMAVAALVLGILSIPAACFFGSGILFGGVAIVLAILAGKKVKSGQAGQGGLAKAGLITGIIGLVLSILILVFFGNVIANVMGDCPSTLSETEMQQCVEDNLGS